MKYILLFIFILTVACDDDSLTNEASDCEKLAQKVYACDPLEDLSEEAYAEACEKARGKDESLSCLLACDVESECEQFNKCVFDCPGGTDVKRVTDLLLREGDIDKVVLTVKGKVAISSFSFFDAAICLKVFSYCAPNCCSLTEVQKFNNRNVSSDIDTCSWSEFFGLGTGCYTKRLGLSLSQLSCSFPH